jgi:hypothetical protein
MGRACAPENQDFKAVVSSYAAGAEATAQEIAYNPCPSAEML